MALDLHCLQLFGNFNWRKDKRYECILSVFYRRLTWFLTTAGITGNTFVAIFPIRIIHALSSPNMYTKRSLLRLIMLSIIKIAIVYWHFQCQGFDYLLNTPKDHFYDAYLILQNHFTFSHHRALFIVPFCFPLQYFSHFSPYLSFCVPLIPQFVHSPPLDHHISTNVEHIVFVELPITRSRFAHC